MNTPVIKIENISKLYSLGTVGIESLQKDVISWFLKLKNGSETIKYRGGKGTEEDYLWALQNVNLDINKGDVIGFIGKNGAGKSTLLKILSRVTAPTSGQIKVHGRIASLLEVGTGFHPELTGRENIFLNGAILGMKKNEIKKKFDEIVQFAGVEKYIDTPVKRYSSGMYVRLAFAVAAHLEPEILIVDEVLAVGDAEFQKKALGKMSEITKGEGRTVLFVSHSMAAIQNLCNRCVVLEKGQLKFSGDVNEGIEYYLSKSLNSSIKNESIELTTNRTGTGNIMFSNFYIESESGTEIDTVLTGQTIFFVFVVKVTKSNAVKVDIGFSLTNMQDIGLANLYSSYQRVFFNDLSEGYHTIKCKISNIAFVPGTLFVRGRILENDMEADWLKDNLGSMNIQMGDFYNTGVIGQTNWGQYLIKGEWSKE
jgi:lipopolysaccharide transport system ATP-binding protein